MGRRSGIAAVLALFLALVAGLCGIRLAARNLLAPLAGLERLALSLKPHVSEPEPVIEELARGIDWDAPASGGGMGRSNPSRIAKAERAFTLSPGSGELPLEANDLELKAGVVRLLVAAIGEAEFQVSLFEGNEPNLENMASTLNLSDSQKARIAALMEWKRATLEGLNETEKADPERIKKIEDYFRAALDLELDQNQAREYAKSRSTLLRFNTVSLRAVQALQQDATELKLKWALEWLTDPAKK
ncbi:MAG TPA: hypothetical protein VK661_02215 [Planctomycetota bacterium]|nr:hypothetical protein [Planctomycetota bacterium]